MAISTVASDAEQVGGQRRGTRRAHAIRVGLASLRQKDNLSSSWPDLIRLDPANHVFILVNKTASSWMAGTSPAMTRDRTKTAIIRDLQMAQDATLIIRVALDGEASVYRDIEIEAAKSLYRLAEAIVSAFGFDFDHAFGFYSGTHGREDAACAPNI